jgi:hypothetical protein
MITRPSRVFGALVCALGLLAGAPSPAPAVEADVVVLQGLDKITARTRTFRVPVGGSRNFGSLEITARHCDKTPPEEPPERKAFLEIVDVRPDREAVKIFSGWMFASSPALNALEHPVYDVWVTDCQVTDGGDGGETGGASQ